MNADLQLSYATVGKILLASHRPDPFDGLLAPTLGGGTSLLCYSIWGKEWTGFSGYVAIPQETLFEYERKMLDLRRELAHYKSLLSELTAEARWTEDYVDQQSTTPLDASSVAVVNSIVAARIPASATFNDFSDEEI